MPGVGFILVPFDGSRETRLSAVEAKSQHVIEDAVRETRLSELLGQRGMDVKFMLTDRGVMIHGDMAQAMTVSRLIDDNLVPSMKKEADVFRKANDNAAHIAEMFGSAARRFNVASVTPVFEAAAHDKPVSLVRGRRPAINGSHMALAA